MSQSLGRQQESNGPSVSTIAADLEIIGDVISKGTVQLEGQVRGNVQCLSLVLGEKSQLEGGVVAEDVAVHGRVIGSIRAERVTLHQNSHVEGEVVNRSLTVERGAHFDGRSRRSDDPLSDNVSSGEFAAVQHQVAIDPEANGGKQPLMSSNSTPLPNSSA